VTTANGFLEAGVLGIYSVATVGDARGQGYATAITRRAIEEAPTATAVLQPSERAEPLYTRLGFERFTMFRTWARSQP
jgi:GNAT superfamily N-acetyltransferase